MKNKTSKLILLFISAIIASYFGIQKVNSSAKVTEEKYIEKKDVNPQEINSEFTSSNGEKIFLKEGNEKFGLTHILMRHSADYYTNYSRKGSLFPEGTTANEVIAALKEISETGELDPKGKGNATALKKVLSLHNEKATYRIIINQDNDIITFFKID